MDYVAIGGPYDPTGPGNTESRKRVFCLPAHGRLSKKTACARKILTSLARQAYRRPVTAADIDPADEAIRDRPRPMELASMQASKWR